MRHFLLFVMFFLLSVEVSSADIVHIKTTYPSREGSFKNLKGQELVLTPLSNPDLYNCQADYKATQSSKCQEGQLYFYQNNGQANPRLWDGTQWVDLTGAVNSTPIVLGGMTSTGNPSTSTSIVSGPNKSKLTSFSDSNWSITEKPAGCNPYPSDGYVDCPDLIDETSPSPESCALHVKMGKFDSGKYKAEWQGTILINADTNIRAFAILQSRSAKVNSAQRAASRWSNWDDSDGGVTDGVPGRGYNGTAPYSGYQQLTVGSVDSPQVSDNDPRELSIRDGQEFRLLVKLTSTTGSIDTSRIQIALQKGFLIRVTRVKA